VAQPRPPLGTPARSRSTPPSSTTTCGRLPGIVADPQRLPTCSSAGPACELVRKYGPTLADVQAYAVEARVRLAQLEGHDARAAELGAALADAARAVEKAARALSEARSAAAGPLAAAVAANLRTLAMPNASFEVVVEPGEFGAAGEDGADDVGFLMAPNPGEPARPLARAASGGELARAMLALRVVLTAAPRPSCSEVDAGTGGEAGTAVGRAATLRSTPGAVTHSRRSPRPPTPRSRVEGGDRRAHRRWRRVAARRRPGRELSPCLQV
jgi:DNA repair ATPase RecN